MYIIDIDQILFMVHLKFSIKYTDRRGVTNKNYITFLNINTRGNKHG